MFIVDFCDEISQLVLTNPLLTPPTSLHIMLSPDRRGHPASFRSGERLDISRSGRGGQRGSAGQGSPRDLLHGWREGRAEPGAGAQYHAGLGPAARGRHA